MASPEQDIIYCSKHEIACEEMPFLVYPHVCIPPARWIEAKRSEIIHPPYPCCIGERPANKSHASNLRKVVPGPERILQRRIRAGCARWSNHLSRAVRQKQGEDGTDRNATCPCGMYKESHGCGEWWDEQKRVTSGLNITLSDRIGPCLYFFASLTAETLLTTKPFTPPLVLTKPFASTVSAI